MSMGKYENGFAYEVKKKYQLLFYANFTRNLLIHSFKIMFFSSTSFTIAITCLLVQLKKRKYIHAKILLIESESIKYLNWINV